MHKSIYRASIGEFHEYVLKVRKSQKQFMVSSILSKNERKNEKFNLTILWYQWLNFFVRIFEDTIICFRDFQTLKALSRLKIEMIHCSFMTKYYTANSYRFAGSMSCIDITVPSQLVRECSSLGRLVYNQERFQIKSGL